MATPPEMKIYGMLLESIQHYIQEEHGYAKWEEIRLQAGITTHTFVTHQKYPECYMRNLAKAKAKVLREEAEVPREKAEVPREEVEGPQEKAEGLREEAEVPREEAEVLREESKQAEKAIEDNMRCFGHCFVKFFMHYGYDRIIRVSGRYLRDFLIGIDSLHEHMRFGYPKLQSPTFYCEEETSTGLTLHYTSKRRGYVNYVVGQVEEIAKMFYDIDVDLKVLGSNTENNVTHAAYRLHFNNTGYKPVEPTQPSLILNRTIPSEMFFSIFPFSFAINCDMTITMAGSGIIATIGNRIVGAGVQDIFTLRRPKTEFTWENLITRHVVFELISKLPTLRRSTVCSLNSYASRDTSTSQPSVKLFDQGKPNSGLDMDRTTTLHLKGQMKFLKNWNKILYICSPLIGSLDGMMRNGLYMSDLSMHDTSMEMVLSGIKPLHQLELARDQQLDKSKTLEENMQKLAEERARSEELLYRMMPKPVADRMKRGDKAISTCEYFSSVTVMFTYMDGFPSICCRVSAMEAVNLVNSMFVRFDNLTDAHDVYKFETLGDALYMIVNGAPVRKDRHAEPMADMALDMIEAVKDMKDPSTGKPITISTGMHLGPVAAGLVGAKTPQYCLFGDTVNIASRLRTTAMPMRTHISVTCNQALENTKFKTEYRGKIELKGKGEVKTYWLTGRKEEWANKA